MTYKLLAGVLIRELNSEKEDLHNANVMKKCPKCLAIGTDGAKLVGIYRVPEENARSLNCARTISQKD